MRSTKLWYSCQLSSFILLCLFTLTQSAATSLGRRRIQERQKRVARAANYQQSKYAQPLLQYTTNSQPYQSASQYQVPYNPNTATSYGQYVSPASGAAYPSSPAATVYSHSAGANPYATTGGNYGYNSAAYAPQPASYLNTGSSYPAGAYPISQTTSNQYPYQAAVNAPTQYGGYSGYGQQQQQQQQPNSGYGYSGYNGYQNTVQGQGRAAIPLVTTPSPMQFVLAEFCQKPDREPICKKNTFGMCDAQDNYPAEVATDFYGYFKAQITAMSTDYDYANSDQYDTGFATQQNKLIDFVHDIFQDNEFGNLPGVPPPQKGLCVGESDTFQPGWAKTSKGRYVVIMNSNTVKQTIRAEVCKNAGKACQNVPKCYRSECRQRFRYDTMLSFDPCDAKKPPKYELFKIPDGCECFVIVDEPDLSNTISGAPIVESAKRSPPKVTPSGRSDAVLTTVHPEVTTGVPTSPITATTPSVAAINLDINADFTVPPLNTKPQSTVTVATQSTGVPPLSLSLF